MNLSKKVLAALAVCLILPAGLFAQKPRAGAPRIATRIRLATSQTVIAVAKLADGSCWRDSVDLLVTLAACID